jgi:hypothetical protein
MGYYSRVMVLSLRDKKSGEFIIDNSYLEDEDLHNLYDINHLKNYDRYINSPELKEFKRMLEDYTYYLTIFINQECKWYEERENLLKEFSKLHPNLIIELYIVGDEREEDPMDGGYDVSKRQVNNGVEYRVNYNLKTSQFDNYDRDYFLNKKGS